jgi:hypothetical protein
MGEDETVGVAAVKAEIRGLREYLEARFDAVGADVDRGEKRQDRLEAKVEDEYLPRLVKVERVAWAVGLVAVLVEAVLVWGVVNLAERVAALLP